MVRKTKIYKIYSLLIKSVIIVTAFWFIYRRIFVRENLDELAESFSYILNQKNFYPIISLVILLMFFNWGTEIVKWKYLIRKIEHVPFIKCIVAVFSGITVSIFTPNRVGEYAGRVFVFERASRWEGVLITMLGSMSQLLVTIIAGAVSFIFFVYKYVDMSDSPAYIYFGLVSIVLLLVFVLLLLFFNVSFMTAIINRLPSRFNKIRQMGVVFSKYSFRELLNVLVLSLLRYIIFITQFYLLLKLFGINIPYLEALILIGMIYLVMTAIPTIALTELGIRGSVSMYFVGMYCSIYCPSEYSDLGILTASSALWVINLAIPAIMGALFIFKLKFFR